LLDELKLYASIGLHKAIKNYDPVKCRYTTFSFYAANYVVGECYTCVTELQPLPTMKKYERRKGYASRQNNPKIMLSLSPKLLGDEPEFFDIIKPAQNNYINEYRELWDKIDTMAIPNFTKKIIKLKFTYTFEKVRSNKQIAVLMGCSEEWVRKNVDIFKHNFVI
jgi:DNA-directed RNA polymerase specialized sigma subunit